MKTATDKLSLLSETERKQKMAIKNKSFYTEFRIILIVFLMMGSSLVWASSEERKLEAFNSIAAFGNINIELIQGDSPYLTIDAKGVELDKVITDVSGGTLKIKIKNSLGNDAEVNIKVYYQKLKELKVSAGAKINSYAPLKSEILKLRVASAGKVKAELIVNELVINVSEGGSVNIKGSADNAVFNSTTGGTIDAFDLIANTVNAEGFTGGLIKVNVTKRASLFASMGAIISYRGTPETKDVKTNLGGKIIDSNDEE